MNRNNKGSRLLTNQAYEYIKAKLLSYEFPPDMLLSESSLSKELKMSRTPIREALYILKVDGLLKEEGSKWKVLGITLEDLKQIFELKIAVENLITEEVARLPFSEKADIRECLEKTRSAATSGDRILWRKYDHELHDCIFRHSHNSRAIKFIYQNNGQWQRFLYRYVVLDLAKSQRQHEEFVGYILEGKPDKAKESYTAHLNSLREEIEYVLKQMVFPFSNNQI
jgi:DNA-binding GntR family transcriptional regulator